MVYLLYTAKFKGEDYYMKKRKKIALLLAVVLMANLTYGCSPGGSSGNGKVREYTISEEEPVIEGDGVKISF